MKWKVSEMHGGWVAFAIFAFIMLIFIACKMEKAKEKQEPKPQMTYPPKKDNGDFGQGVYDITEEVGTKLIAFGAGIVAVVLPLTALYFIAIQF
tara:strand:+ start:1559 stop:1840 length:282 start_codon:yes stop_codon:yes gene_type:complete